MKAISIIIIFDGINTAFTKHPNDNLRSTNFILGIIIICIGISLLSKRKYSYYSAIIAYIIRIIILIYFIFALIIMQEFQFAPVFLIFILLCLYIGIITHIRNRKVQFI